MNHCYTPVSYTILHINYTSIKNTRLKKRARKNDDIKMKGDFKNNIPEKARKDMEFLSWLSG